MTFDNTIMGIPVKFPGLELSFVEKQSCHSHSQEFLKRILQAPRDHYLGQFFGLLAKYLVIHWMDCIETLRK